MDFSFDKVTNREKTKEFFSKVRSMDYIIEDTIQAGEIKTIGIQTKEAYKYFLTGITFNESSYPYSNNKCFGQIEFKDTSKGSLVGCPISPLDFNGNDVYFQGTLLQNFCGKQSDFLEMPGKVLFSLNQRESISLRVKNPDTIPHKLSVLFSGWEMYLL